jgi:hypothetical protein
MTATATQIEKRERYTAEMRDGKVTVRPTQRTLTTLQNALEAVAAGCGLPGLTLAGKTAVYLTAYVQQCKGEKVDTELLDAADQE